MMIEQPQILRRACEGFEDLRLAEGAVDDAAILHQRQEVAELVEARLDRKQEGAARHHRGDRSEEHTSELQSLMRISYAVFCLKKKKKHTKMKTENRRTEQENERSTSKYLQNNQKA